MTHLRLEQLPTGLSCRRRSPNTPVTAFTPLSLPGLTEQVSPSKLLLGPSLVWEGNRHWTVAYKQRQAPNQRGAPAAMWAKERKGICSRSHRCIGLNPCNEPEAVNFGDNCGVWEQVQTGVRPGLSLSWPHSGSRDLPRKLEDFLIKQIGWSSLCGENIGGLRRTFFLLPLSPHIFSFSSFVLF